MKTTVIIFFLLSILVISCNEKTKQPIKLEKERNEVSTTKKADTSDVDIQIVKKELLLSKAIDVQSIKEQVDGVTTTFLQRKESIIYPDMKKNNFYGHYTLIKEDNEGIANNIVGNLIIYDSINPYIYEKTTDEFIEINLIGKGVSLYNKKIEVGMSLKDLIAVAGHDYERIGNETLFYKISDSKRAFFKVRDSIITKIKIGIYRKDVSNRKLLEQTKWYLDN